MADLEMNDNTRGVETTWIYNGGGASVVLRSDMNMAKDNETMPLINSTEDLKYKYQLPSTEFISFISLFEYRPPANTTLNFSVTTDDGFMVGYNQNPFERLNNLDWGSWALQGPTTHKTPRPYQIDVTTPSARNNFVVKWFQHQGLSVFKMLMADGSNPPKNVATDRSVQQNMYLTQEPNAPWLQYEVFASSPIIEGGGMAFCEKRFRITDRPFTSVSSFHASMEGGASLHTEKDERKYVPGNKGYISLIRGSSWKTTGKFCYNAFKTITVLVRPKYLPANTMGIIFSSDILACLIENDGERYIIAGGGGTDSDSRDYHDYIPNEWNLIVIQFVNTDGYGIRNIGTNCCPLSKLATKSQRQAFVDNLSSRRNTTSPIFLPNAKTQNDISEYRYSSKLVLGKALGIDGFDGDIAWLHGFRDYFTTEDTLKAEINSSWISRWESKPTVSGFKGSSSKATSSAPPKSEGFFSQFKW